MIREGREVDDEGGLLGVQGLSGFGDKRMRVFIGSPTTSVYTPLGS